MNIKIVEYLMYFFGILFVLNWFSFFFVFPSFGEIPIKISAILSIVLTIICFILASILAKKEKGEKENENN